MAERVPPEPQTAPAPELADDTVVRRAAPPGFIHLGVAKEIYPVLNELGADAERVIEEADLDSRLFERADNLIPVSALGTLLLLCVERMRCAHFGLLVGRKSTLKSLRAVGALMRCSDTFGDAVRSMNLHLRVQNRGAVTQLEVEGEVAVLTYSLYNPGSAGAVQIIDGARSRQHPPPRLPLFPDPRRRRHDPGAVQAIRVQGLPEPRDHLGRRGPRHARGRVLPRPDPHDAGRLALSVAAVVTAGTAAAQEARFDGARPLQAPRHARLKPLHKL